MNKFEKAIKDYLDKHKIRRDMDVEELHLDNL